MPGPASDMKRDPILWKRSAMDATGAQGHRQYSETMKKSKNYVALFYVLAVFILIPIYNKGTFSNITGHKIEAFYFVSGLTLILYVIASFIQDFRTKENAKEAGDSANSRSGKRTVLGAFGVGIASPHFSMALFGAAVLISTILSGFTKETSSGFSFETVKESI